MRVQSLQLDAGVGGCELPVGFGVVLVAVVLPCGDFVGEDLLVSDAAIQTLRREAFVGNWAERLPLRINSLSRSRSSASSLTTYFLTAISFPATNHLHRCLAATEIQKFPS